LSRDTVHEATRAGDPILAAGEARRKQLRQLRDLEQQLRHQFLDPEERCELQDFLGKLRRRVES
jgi:hypothetical protein